MTTKKIKMLVTDLDGTLLRTDKTVSENTKAALLQCREAGIKVAYATARSISAEKLVPPSLFDGKVATNGAIVEVEGEVIYRRLIPSEVARPILLAGVEHGLHMTSQDGEKHYTNTIVKIPDHWCALDWEVVDFSQHNIDASKIYTYDLTAEDVAFIQNLLPSDLYMVIAIDGLAMIMHREATKSKGVAELARHWGISPSEIVAFGDDLNDIDMLSFAGTSVAMENALESVKAVADFTCGNNDEDGIAKWITNIL
ncbi:MAG: HAD family hydrolase [Defluviitaleaceae bacterium]|nr:HAD family hydrolase [Defluviitaleaceae bacterium]